MLISIALNYAERNGIYFLPLSIKHISLPPEAKSYFALCLCYKDHLFGMRFIFGTSKLALYLHQAHWPQRHAEASTMAPYLQ